MTLNIQKISLAALVFGATVTGSVQAQSAPRLVLNDRPFRTHVAPVTQDGRVLVPLRDIFEGLGARVDYDDLNRTITARRRGTVVHMALGSRRAEINGQRVRLDVPANTIYGSTMVPLRFVSEALGAIVNYYPDRDVVHINDPATAPNDDHRDGDHGDRDHRDGDHRDGDHRDDSPDNR